MGVLFITLLKCWNFDDNYFNTLRKEAMRRYGTSHGSTAKLLYELIDNGIQESILKPSFDELKDKPPFPGAPKNKKIDKIQMKYVKIVKWFIDNNVDMYEKPKILQNKIEETWRSKSTYERKAEELIKMYNEWMIEIELGQEE